MYMKLVPVLIAACLAGCSTVSQTKLQGELATFQGKPVSAMIERFGVPAQQREADGKRLLTWSKQQESFGQAYYMGFENDSSYVARCRIDALVSDDIVERITHDGTLEDCKVLGML
jgi:hypothetical protein